MYKTLSKTIITTLLFFLTVIAYSQEVTENNASDKKVDSKSDTNEKTSKPLKPAEGRKVFEKLSKEEKQKILERWEELKKLPPNERRKALQNFYRLLQVERGEGKKDPVKPSEVKTNKVDKNSKIGKFMHRMKYDDIQRRRFREYNELLKEIRRDDPHFFEKLKKLPPDERYKLILEKRQSLIEYKFDRIAEDLKLKKEETKKLTKLLEIHRKQYEKLHRENYKIMMKLLKDTTKKIKGNKLLGEKVLKKIYPLLEPGYPRRMRGYKPGERHKPGERRGPNSKFKPGERRRPDDRFRPGERHRPDDRRRPGERMRPDEKHNPGRMQPPSKR